MPTLSITDERANVIVERQKLINDTLHELNARCIRQEKLKSPPSMLEWFASSGQVFIIQYYGLNPLGRNGFEIYAPISRSAKISDTLQELKAYIAKPIMVPKEDSYESNIPQNEQ